MKNVINFDPETGSYLTRDHTITTRDRVWAVFVRGSELNGPVFSSPDLNEALVNTLSVEDEEYTWESADVCPGCGCEPGDGITESCNDEDGCAYSKAVR